ncbi:GNAT family N-acetyltransferase [Polynucleobacter necessarius]|nr:GNAT family N-acetyltransferase [Polynucleobacter necessarius]
MHSQVTAIPFYEKLGFLAQGTISEEAGIPHRTMMLALPT